MIRAKTITAAKLQRNRFSMASYLTLLESNCALRKLVFDKRCKFLGHVFPRLCGYILRTARQVAAVEKERNDSPYQKGLTTLLRRIETSQSPQACCTACGL